MRIRTVLLTAATLAAIAPPALAAQNITKRATVVADAAIDVSNVQGRVDVTAWDRNEVELVAVLASDKDTLEFEATEREVRVKVRRPEGQKRWHGEDEDADLTLRVPKGARLSVSTVSADIGVAGVRGEQRLGTVSGDLRTQAFDEPVSVRSVSGDATVAGTGGRSAVSADTVSGTAIVNGIRGSFEGVAVSGDLDVTISAADRLRAKTVSGNLRANAELTSAARVDLGSISGDIVLKVKPPVNAEFEIESFSGDIDSCFGGKARARSKHGPGSELTMTQGGGGARVHVKTLSGEIEVCDR
ncbi:MAG TPA: DUF4097 family beta strand repeat-containing protein [Steroidobacteraceae bacterium]|nr:DUF4097 family beta strand repeat-containing protein [Steroidobacteraceae bacterium]